MFSTAKFFCWCALATKEAACLKFNFDHDPHASRSPEFFRTHFNSTLTATSLVLTAITAVYFSNYSGKAPLH